MAAVGVTFAMVAGVCLGTIVPVESHLQAAWRSAEPLREYRLTPNAPQDVPYSVTVQTGDNDFHTFVAKAGDLPPAAERMSGRGFDITYSETLFDHLGFTPSSGTSKKATAFKPF